MRDIKQRQRKQRHQNAGVETARNGNCGTMLRGWKMRAMKIRERLTMESSRRRWHGTCVRQQYSVGSPSSFTPDTHGFDLRVVPSLYYQLFTAFVPHADNIFPVYYALMTRKTTELYKAVLQKLQELAPDFHPHARYSGFWRCSSIAAVRAVFDDNIAVSGCWFQYAQILIKRLFFKMCTLTNLFTLSTSVSLSIR